jgi:hypothetical protein
VLFVREPSRLPGFRRRPRLSVPGRASFFTSRFCFPVCDFPCCQSGSSHECLCPTAAQAERAGLFFSVAAACFFPVSYFLFLRRCSPPQGSPVLQTRARAPPLGLEFSLRVSLFSEPFIEGACRWKPVLLLNGWIQGSNFPRFSTCFRRNFLVTLIRCSMK